MSSERFPNVRRLFHEARQLPEQSRWGFLEEKCGADIPLRDEIRALLQADRELGSLSPSDAPVAAAITRPVVAGYHIIGEVGRGGMGIVWEAVQLGTRRKVALKLMRDPAIGAGRRRDRFSREIELTARFQHPNIARIYDSGESGDNLYYAMELIDGVPPDEFAKKHNLSQRSRVALMRKICEAVQYAHQRGVIHRDLKPSNILVDSAGEPHLLDFGLAKILQNEDAPNVSVEGELAGSPFYMSPEQARGLADAVDTRSDVYSLGVLLYQLVLGELPYESSGGFLQVLRRAADHQIRPPRSLQPKLDRELEAIILKALAAEPRDRYSTASELADDLGRLGRGDPILARPNTLAYVVRKGLAKHWLASSVAAAVGLSFVLLGTIEQIRISREKNQAMSSRASEAVMRHLAEEESAQLLRQLYVSQMNLAGQSLQTTFGIGQIEQILTPWREHPDLLGWEWYYLKAATHQEVLLLPFHRAASAHCVAWSPDGSMIASGGSDQAIYICDSHTGMPRHILRGLAASIYAIAWNREGDKIVSGDADKSVCIWDARTGNLLQTLHDDGGAIRSVDWSPDGTKVIAGSADNTARIFDTHTGSLLVECAVNTASRHFVAVAWSPSGDRIALGSTGDCVKIIDTGGKEICNANAFAGYVRTVAWSPDGKELAWAGDNTNAVTIWKMNSADPPRQIPGPRSPVWRVSWSPDGRRIATASYGDDTVRIYDAASSTEINAFKSHAGPVFDVAWSADNRRLASASADSTVRIWDAERQFPTVFHGSTDTVHTLAWSPTSGRLASGGLDRILRIWPVASSNDPVFISAHDPFCWAAAWSPDESILATSGTGSRISLWNPTNWTEVGELPLPKVDAACLGWSPDGTKCASGDRRGTVRVFNVSQRKQALSFQTHPGWIWAIAVSVSRTTSPTSLVSIGLGANGPID
jgi:WD40 repeat protein/serine/threonine protein kinase